jgi:hypothetical protein
MPEEHKDAGIDTPKSDEPNSQVAVGVKPWAEMSLEEQDVENRKRGFNNEGDRIGGDCVVDPAAGVDCSTMLIFKLNKDSRQILHSLMLRHDHATYVETFDKLLKEEAARIGDISCQATQKHDDMKMPLYKLVTQWFHNIKWQRGEK